MSVISLSPQDAAISLSKHGVTLLWKHRLDKTQTQFQIQLAQRITPRSIKVQLWRSLLPILGSFSVQTWTNVDLFDASGNFKNDDQWEKVNVLKANKHGYLLELSTGTNYKLVKADNYRLFHRTLIDLRSSESDSPQEISISCNLEMPVQSCYRLFVPDLIGSDGVLELNVYLPETVTNSPPKKLSYYPFSENQHTDYSESTYESASLLSRSARSAPNQTGDLSEATLVSERIKQFAFVPPLLQGHLSLEKVVVDLRDRYVFIFPSILSSKKIVERLHPSLLISTKTGDPVNIPESMPISIQQFNGTPLQQGSINMEIVDQHPWSVAVVQSTGFHAIVTIEDVSTEPKGNKHTLKLSLTVELLNRQRKNAWNFDLTLPPVIHYKDERYSLDKGEMPKPGDLLTGNIYHAPTIHYSWIPSKRVTLG